MSPTDWSALTWEQQDEHINRVKQKLGIQRQSVRRNLRVMGFVLKDPPVPRCRHDLLVWECGECEAKAAAIKVRRSEMAAQQRTRDDRTARLHVSRHGPCELCGRETKRVFDHCHTKGHFRGWLCTSCNSGLGMFRDDPMLLEAAATYLRERTG